MDGKQSNFKIVEVTLAHKDIIGLYPNPANDQLFLNAESIAFYQVIIKDALGKIIVSLNAAAPQQPISISNLNRGNIFYNVYESNYLCYFNKKVY